MSDYELDDLDRALLEKCRTLRECLDEDDYREAVDLLVAVTKVDLDEHPPLWPCRCAYLPDLGYVVWRDVFEGQMKCSLEDAVRAHKEAVFVSRMYAEQYCAFRNELWP